MAVSEVLVRRVLIDKLKDFSIQDFLAFFKDFSETTTNYSSTYSSCYTYICSFITGDLFDVKALLDKKVDDNTTYFFNNSFNCGGYALKVDTCIFPNCGGFERSVSSILDTFPFVRLLGDTELKSDEYLVLYRYHDGNLPGHHFVRVEDDGSLVDKNGSEPPKKFSGWGISLRDVPQAVFAVKKEHEMNFYEKHKNISIPSKGSMNFSESAWNAIQNKENSFEYHNHNYNFKKSPSGTVYICNIDEVVAEMLLDTDGDYVVDVRDGKQSFISNTKPSTPIVINEPSNER